MSDSLIQEHRRVCQQNMKVIVHDEDLWRDFRSLSEIEHRKELNQTPPIKQRALYTSVLGYKIAFGEDKTYFRANIPSGKVYRDDVFIMKDDRVVAQIVDYIAEYRSIDGTTSVTCLPFYENLVLGDFD